MIRLRKARDRAAGKRVVTVLRELRAPSKASLEKAMHGHVIGQAQLIGTCQKQHR